MPDHHVIITGAAGFIGAAAVEECLRHGWRVTALIHRRRVAETVSWHAHPQVNTVRGSITDRDRLPGLLSKAITEAGGSCRAVINCAGRAGDVGWERSFRATNLTGVENLCGCVRQLGIGRLVQVSTTDVYGVRDFDHADERTAFNNNQRNVYPKYKILAERAIHQQLDPSRYAIVRPGLVWGPGDTTVQPRAIAFLRQSPFMVHFGRWRGRNRWPLAYVGNVARVIRTVAATDDALGQAFNVIDSEITSVDEYYRLLLDLFLPKSTGKRAITLPYWVAVLPARLSTLLSNLLNLNHPLFDPSHYSLGHICHDQHFSGEKAAALMRAQGTELLSREEALQEFRTWIQESTVASSR